MRKHHASYGPAEGFDALESWWKLLQKVFKSASFHVASFISCNIPEGATIPLFQHAVFRPILSLPL
ncbi:hypothetical protein I7I50_07214 [Histoplasma capsulatum G186AR]|uniref:Uncharacterized protein n=1 Tax=Ajellomyces capsulatus TaxID=5037 RepID=A0A8H7YYG9_AJECA|nr:hypothetical protein I7I52_09714 [Histoplasma capsulatum]QSS67968.1 hypothetical protein I7I50_07214 [Histoplasma capsulatum G186AR]